ERLVLGEGVGAAAAEDHQVDRPGVLGRPFLAKEHTGPVGAGAVGGADAMAGAAVVRHLVGGAGADDEPARGLPLAFLQGGHPCRPMSSAACRCARAMSGSTMLRTTSLRTGV